MARARQRIRHRGVNLTIQTDGAVTLGDDGPQVGRVRLGGGSSTRYWYPEVEINGMPGSKSAAAAVVFDDFLLGKLTAEDVDGMAQVIAHRELH